MPARTAWRHAILAVLALGGAGLAWALARGAAPGVFVAHAALMLWAWCVALPLGALVARFLKVLPEQGFPAVLDNRFWWQWHRWLQYAGVGAMVAGFAAMLSLTGGSFATQHGQIGMVVVLLGCGQMALGWLRGSKGGPTDATMRGDHYDMTERRRVFEALHRVGGWIAMLFGWAAVITGLALVAAPAWAYLAVLLAMALVVGAFGRMQARGRIPTYNAIWGHDPPGRHTTAVIPPST